MEQADVLQTLRSQDDDINCVFRIKPTQQTDFLLLVD